MLCCPSTSAKAASASSHTLLALRITVLDVVEILDGRLGTCPGGLSSGGIAKL